MAFEHRHLHSYTGKRVRKKVECTVGLWTVSTDDRLSECTKVQVMKCQSIHHMSMHLFLIFSALFEDFDGPDFLWVCASVRLMDCLFSSNSSCSNNSLVWNSCFADVSINEQLHCLASLSPSDSATSRSRQSHLLPTIISGVPSMVDLTESISL